MKLISILYCLLILPSIICASLREMKAVYSTKSTTTYRAPTPTTYKPPTTTAYKAPTTTYSYSSSKTKTAYYSPSYTYSYSTKASQRVYYNEYFDPIAMRTYYPLYAYYFVPYYNPLGYYSLLYLTVYYDGYGYNFYYGGYGYYEYSVMPVASAGSIVGVLIGVIGCCCCMVVCLMWSRTATEHKEEHKNKHEGGS